MKSCAFIPARGGSKRVPAKNLARIGGRSLIERAVHSAGAAGCHVVMSTDSATMASEAWRAFDCMPPGPRNPQTYELHQRPTQIAGDHSQIEDAMAHYWTRLDDKPDVIVLLQPTSPFRTAAHVREALRLLEVTGADSVVGVTVGHEHHFAGRLKPREYLPPRDGGTMFSAAYDAMVRQRDEQAAFYDWQPFAPIGMDRPRTQDLRPMGAENGALYCVRREFWEKSGLRAGGHMVALPMTWIEGFDIDTEDCIRAANALVAGGVAE